jgi:hypothetical protein
MFLFRFAWIQGRLSTAPSLRHRKGIAMIATALRVMGAIGLAGTLGCGATESGPDGMPPGTMDLPPSPPPPPDRSPRIGFEQVGKTVGIVRSNEPASAANIPQPGGAPPIVYGSWLADLDGDGRLDYYAVSHSQVPHMSGLFINNGNGGFGKNLFTVSAQPAADAFPNLDITNEMRFVGDITGDGKVDLYFQSWSGRGALCVNQGIVPGPDWTGPGYVCYGTSDALAFADVNGDGKIDVLALDDDFAFDVYEAYYSQTARYKWRLNDGTPNLNNWPTSSDFLSLRVTDPHQVAAPFVDLNNDGIPDKIVGIPQADHGTYDTEVGGQRVLLGQANGTYQEISPSGLETASAPVTRLDDVNEDGCIDVGTDITGYRDNQTWYLQNKHGTTCTGTFTATPRTALPYYPGFKHYDVDVDNSGVLAKAVIIHKAYSNDPGYPGGVSIYRKQPDGSYGALTPGATGIQINGDSTTEFYADNLSPGDWNDDGRIDLAGTGSDSITNTDDGLALWTSTLATTNSWVKITLPQVTGFFRGSATIEVFDAGFLGDPAHLATPAKLLYPGKAWATQVYHFGIGTRPSVDIRVTFPDGQQSVRKGVAAASRISL